MGANYDIEHKPLVLKVERTKLNYTTLSYRVTRAGTNDAVFAGLSSPAAFKAHVVATINKDWLFPHAEPAPTMIQKTWFKGEEIEMRLGVIKVLNKHVEDVKRRSGRNSSLIYTWEKDEETSIHYLPRGATIKDAQTAATK